MADEANFKCEECIQFPASCRECIQKHHQFMPLHNISEAYYHAHTSVKYWKRVDLSTLGFVLHLGHYGMACPNIAPPSSPPKKMLVVHRNGMHQVRLVYCQCAGAPDNISQLMEAGFFPATTEHPQTVFTQTVIKEFRMHRHESAMTAHAYHAALQHLTNPVLKGAVEVRMLVYQFRSKLILLIG